MMVVFREELQRDAEIYQQGIDAGFKNGYAEGCKVAWRRLFWLMLAASFVGSLLSLTAIFLTMLIHL